MIRPIFFLSVLLFLSTAAVAQDKAIFHGGFYAGIATSQLSGDQLSGFKKPGAYAGAFINLHLGPQSLLQLEISYIQKGSRSVSKTIGLVYAVNLQYFEMPLLYKYQFPGKLRRFGLEAGPALGFLIKNTDVERNSYGLLYNRPPFNRIDLSAMGGLSVMIIDGGKCDMTTDIRVSQSVIRVRKHFSGEVYRLNRGQYNSVLSLTLAFEF
jgi:hypothetical protein